MRIPKAENLEEYNKVLAERAGLANQLRTSRLQERSLIQHWLESKQQLPQAVSSDKMMLRLKLDEGGGEVLHNSAPQASPAIFEIGKSKPQWGETTWLWPDMRQDATTRIVLGQTGDFEWNQPFSVGGWMMVRSMPNTDAWGVKGALISKMPRPSRTGAGTWRRTAAS